MEPPPSALRLAAEGNTKGRFWKAVAPWQNLLGGSNDALFPAAVPRHRQVKEQNTAPGTLAGEGWGPSCAHPGRIFMGFFVNPRGTFQHIRFQEYL